MSIFYVIFVLLTAYFSYRYDGIEEYDSHKQHRLWLMCGYMILLTGFSYGLGGDKFVYMEEFEVYPSTFSDIENYIWYNFMLNGQMPFWTLTNMIAKVLFGSFYALQLIQSAVVNISVCYIMTKYTNRYFIFLLVYFFSLQFFILNTEIMREGFSLAFAIIGMHAWMKGKKWLFFLMFLAGLMFHISAVVMLAFPFAFFRITWKTLPVAFVIAFLIWLLSDIILSRVMMSVLGGMGIMVTKILYYSIHASTIFGFLRSAITYLIFPFIIMYTVMLNDPDDESRRRKETLVSFVVILGIIASSLAGFNRVYNYVQIFYLYMLAEFTYTLFRVKEHLIMRMGTWVGTAFLIFLLYTIHYKTTNKYFYEFYYPYTCILDEDKSVYIRQVTHIESSGVEDKENNVRDIE